jgi:electron transfer flavoprotein alpha subunit
MVLVFAESPFGELKKAAFELVTYGKKVADLLGTGVVALTIGKVNNAAVLGQYGASKIYHVDTNVAFDSQVYTSIIAQATEKVGAKVVILGNTSTGKALLGRLAVRLDAGSVSAATSLPVLNDGFKVKKNVFSGKGIVEYNLTSDKKVISLQGNTFPPEIVGTDAPVEALSVNIPASRIQVLSVDTVKGQVPLPEAELVVSAGRGMKAPENWGIIEELAATLNATTACSRPVADIHWRPHHEHVGQTGVAIRPNLYIAVGISGAIQHLAGVNQSKCIVVINKDPEAPFFKAADYGVVGDLFEVVPKLTAALKKHKG